MSHLQIADPGVSIQSTLLLLVILWIQIIPARIVAVRGLYALVRQIVEIRAKVSFHHLPIDVDDLSVKKLDKVFLTDGKNCMTMDAIVHMSLHTACSHEFWNIVSTEESSSYLEAGTSSK